MAAQESAATLEQSSAQVRLQFSTRDIDLALPEQTGPVLVPTSFRRYALSTLINSLIGSEIPTPLEFLVNGSYLRTSLEDYLNENGVSAEDTLAVEYIRARAPPRYVTSFEHDDWVGSVHAISGASIQDRILSGSYDGHLRVWNPSSQVLATSPIYTNGGHSGSIFSARFVSPSQIVSAGQDGAIRLWRYGEGDDNLSGSITPQLALYGHQDTVQSVRADAKSNRIISASHDHTVGLWSTRKSDAPEAPASLLSSARRSSKRQRLNPAVTVPQRGPLSLLKKHTEQVSGAVFDTRDTTVGYSTSWDKTLRTWDLVTTALVDTRTTSHSLFCVEQMPELNLLAAGSVARHITLIDPRDSAVTVSAMTLRGHTNMVVTLAHDPHSQYGLVSGSHDGECRVWDIRSTKNSKDGPVGSSIYKIERDGLKGKPRPVAGESSKVFTVFWDNHLGVLSGSEDKSVQINSGGGIVSNITQ